MHFLRLSFLPSLLVVRLQHMAVSRRIFNPIEEKGIVGITNYIDLGEQ
jgi:hypothetical protein